MSAKNFTAAPFDAKSNDEFFHEFVEPIPEWSPVWTHPQRNETYHLCFTGSPEAAEADLVACRDLVTKTSQKDFVDCGMGWDEAMKLKEMGIPGMRFIIVREGNRDDGPVVAFTSFRPVDDEARPALYCYEVHLEPHMRRCGLGSYLMGLVHAVAANLEGVECTMLTCLRHNESSRSFYEKLGYTLDPSSPGYRRLRGPKRFPPYVILSRDVWEDE